MGLRIRSILNKNRNRTNIKVIAINRKIYRKIGKKIKIKMKIRIKLIINYIGKYLQPNYNKLWLIIKIKNNY
jgi:hypothetical protein